jgi:hypothetical protein
MEIPLFSETVQPDNTATGTAGCVNHKNMLPMEKT